VASVAVPMAMPNKELFPYLVSVITVLHIRSRPRFSLGFFFVATSLYAFIARPYFLLWEAAFVTLLLLRRHRFIGVVAAIVATVGIAAMALGGPEHLNVYELDLHHQVNTLIHRPFHGGSIFAQILNALTSFVRLLLPLELVRHGLPHLAFATTQVVVTSVVLFGRREKSGWSQEHLAAAAYLSFIIVQSVFVPDFGTFVRHQAVVLPWLVVVLGHSAPVGNRQSDQFVRRFRQISAASMMRDRVQVTTE
jgi:hypothetical protein